LIDSLRQFSSSLTILDHGRSAIANTSQFPLVVARNASRSELRQAVESTRVGGFVYVEVDTRWSRQCRHRHPRSNQTLRGFRGCLSFLQQLNLSDVQSYWHWPDFDSCNEIIPLHDRAAAICSLGRRGGDSRARWKRRLARLLLETRFFNRFVPCFSIIGRRCS
jgi:hypothetical protein